MIVLVEGEKYKRKMGNILNYTRLSEYQMLIYTKVEILIIWNEGESWESQECLQWSFLN